LNPFQSSFDINYLLKDLPKQCPLTELSGHSAQLIELSVARGVSRVSCFELYAQSVWLEGDSTVVIH